MTDKSKRMGTFHYDHENRKETFTPAEYASQQNKELRKEIQHKDNVIKTQAKQLNQLRDENKELREDNERLKVPAIRLENLNKHLGNPDWANPLLQIESMQFEIHDLKDQISQLQEDMEKLVQSPAKQCPAYNYFSMVVVNSHSGKAPDGVTDMDVDVMKCLHCGEMDSE